MCLAACIKITLRLSEKQMGSPLLCVCLFANQTDRDSGASRRVAPSSIQELVQTLTTKRAANVWVWLDGKVGPILQNSKTCFVEKHQYLLNKAPTVPKQYLRNRLSGRSPRGTASGKTSEYSPHPARRYFGGQLLQLPTTAAAFSLASALDLSHGARALPSINSEGWNSKRGVASMPRFGCPSKSAFSCRKRQRRVGGWVGGWS